MNATISQAVQSISRAVDVRSPAAMRGQCLKMSTALVELLDGVSYIDEYECSVTIRAHLVQMWDAPAVIANNPLAYGHYICRIDVDGDTLYVDMTAAQFPELGHVGPALCEARRPAWDAFFSIGD